MMTTDKTLHKKYFSSKENLHISRYNWIVKYFLKDVKDKNILEIGCGDGGVVQLLKDENEVRGIDISTSGVKYANKIGIPTKLRDVSSEKLPYPDKYFDYVLIFEVFEHLRSPQHAIEEIQRVLKPNGILLVSIPNHTTGHQYLYPILFRFSQFKNYLEHNGFKVTKQLTYGLSLGRFNKILYKPNPNKQVKNAQKVNSNSILTFLRGLLYSETVSKFKPAFLGWLMVYEAKNIDWGKANEIYKKIATETSHSY